MRLEHPSSPNQITRVGQPTAIEAAADSIHLLADMDARAGNASFPNQQGGRCQGRDSPSNQVVLRV